jgi:hypothetical protein
MESEERRGWEEGKKRWKSDKKQRSSRERRGKREFGRVER